MNQDIEIAERLKMHLSLIHIWLCIKHGWFTRGDCKAYDKLLKMPYDAKGKLRNITTTILCNMAQAIMQYSDPETYEILEFEGILYCLSEICHTCFSVED